MSDEINVNAPPPETPATEPGPITAENVVSEEVKPPMSSVLSDRIEKMLAARNVPEKPQPSAEEQRLQAILTALEAQNGAAPAQPDPQAELQQELQAVRKQQEQMRQELVQREEEANLLRASEEVAQYVQNNDEHYPLVNAAGMQQWVFQKMHNTRLATGRMPSESSAAQDMNEEIAEIVHKCAPLLGYQKGDQRGQREEPVNVNTVGLNYEEPPNRDAMTHEERLEHVLRNL